MPFFIQTFQIRGYLGARRDRELSRIADQIKGALNRRFQRALEIESKAPSIRPFSVCEGICAVSTTAREEHEERLLAFQEDTQAINALFDEFRARAASLGYTLRGALVFPGYDTNNSLEFSIERAGVAINAPTEESPTTTLRGSRGVAYTPLEVLEGADTSDLNGSS